MTLFSKNTLLGKILAAGALGAVLTISLLPTAVHAVIVMDGPSSPSAATCAANTECSAARQGATRVCSDVRFNDGVEKKMCTGCNIEGAAACQAGTSCNQATGSCMSEEVADAPAVPVNQPLTPTGNQNADGVVFVPLTGIPGLTDISSAESLSDFLNVLYRLCIGAAATLAVIQIIRAGFMWMRGDSVTGTKEARNLIQMSVFGLILVLSPVIVFGIIDPRILNLSLDTSSLEVGDPSPLGGAGTWNQEMVTDAVVESAQSCGVTATKAQAQCFYENMPDRESTKACFPGITEDQFQCMGTAFLAAAEEIRDEENQCQAVAPITEGKMVSDQYKNCCQIAGFSAVRYGLHNTNYMCTKNAPEQQAPVVSAPEGTYNFVLYALSSDETCVQVVYGSYPDNNVCTAGLAAEQNNRPTFTPLFSCKTPPLPTLTFNLPVCQNITTLP